MMITEDVKLAFDTITKKVEAQTDMWKYYLGDQPTVYAASRLKDIFHGVDANFTENWCAVVIDSLKERIDLVEIDERLAELWDRNGMSLEADDIHEAALVAGEAYLIVWPDEDGNAEMYFNDGRMCHVFQRADKPRVKRMAAKLWIAEDGTYRLTLYYPDRLEYWKTTQKAENVTAAEAFVADDSVYPDARLANEYGIVPVWQFKPRRQPLSDLANVIQPQNAANKLVADMMVAAEYGAFRQRWIITAADASALKNAPNEIWTIPAGDGMGQSSQVGEFSPTDLANYFEAAEKLAGDIGKITRTPKHYFFSQGGDPSGEALIAMEAPLNKKAQDRIERFEPVWQEALAFAASIDSITIDPKDIVLTWAPATTVQPKTEAEVRLLDTQAGIPLVTTLRRGGWSESELKQLQDDKQAASAEMGDAMLSAFEDGE